jgi:hypothetical protein
MQASAMPCGAEFVRKYASRIHAVKQKKYKCTGRPPYYDSWARECRIHTGVFDEWLSVSDLVSVAHAAEGGTARRRIVATIVVDGLRGSSDAA